MIIICPYCKASKDIGDVRIPKAGAAATCQGCKRQFELRPEPESASAPEEPRIDSCPSCGFAAQSETGICPECGLVFAKYLARVRRGALLEDPSDNITFTPAAEKSVVRQLLGSRPFWGIALFFLLAAWVKFGHDWKLDKYYLLQPGNWQGEMSFRGKQHPFLLVIQSTDDGKLEGYMDWVGTMPRYRLAIRGTHMGNHLLFEDYKFLEGDGKYGLHDKKNVYIIENEMNGTDKNGNATLHAVKVATEPDSARELQKY